ncbi:MAG: tetratricopeptide repeat protein [Flavobacteriales bacterium]|jgi:tetratricopeptide (TPR) repeat protein|tara:strand:+ start:1392 stop:2777 length:1386 start_codon:yes stop_codon:yes gene_type:complete
MKKILIRSLFLIFSIGIYSQSNEECFSNLSIFAEYAKVKNYDAAYEPWLKVKAQCPELNSAIYIYGERLLKNFIKKSEGNDKDEYKEDLLDLYGEWLKYFPKSKSGKNEIGKILAIKAQSMIDYKLADDQGVYDVYDEAFNKDPMSFKSPKGLYNYFKIYFKLYKEDSSNVSLEKVFEKYEELTEKFEFEMGAYTSKLDLLLKKEENNDPISSRELRNKKVYEVNMVACNTYLNNLNAIIAKESTCENLIPLYRKSFDKFKSDAIWLNRAASRMDSKDCSDDPLFVELVEALHDLNPSANSAYYLGLLNDKKGETKLAIDFYNESIDLETSGLKKAKTLYKIALKFKKSRQYSQSRTYALKALKYQPSMGRAYLLIGNLYASSANKCGTTQFEKRSIYWLAAKEAKKAASVDASIRKTAKKTALSYDGRAPSKTDIFSEAMGGKTISIKCWIGKTIAVPAL